MIRGYTIAAALYLMLFASAAVASDVLVAPSGISLGADLGLSFGGNDLLTPEVIGSNPELSTSSKLPAGDAVYGDVRLRQEIFQTGFAVQTGVGYAYTCEAVFCFGDGIRGSYAFQRVTADLLASYHWDVGNVRNRIGIGRTFHFWNQLTSGTSHPFHAVYFAPAQGWILQYQMGKIGVRYTNIIYRSKTSSNTVNGSSLGIFISFDGDD